MHTRQVGCTGRESSGSTDFFSEKPENKYFRLYRPDDDCHNYSALLTWSPKQPLTICKQVGMAVSHQNFIIKSRRLELTYSQFYCQPLRHTINMEINGDRQKNMGINVSSMKKIKQCNMIERGREAGLDRVAREEMIFEVRPEMLTS